MPGNDAIEDTMSVRSGRRVGSPPVSLILVTPEEAKREASRVISAVERRFERGVRSMPSSGMQ